MKTYLRSIPRCAALWALGFGLVIATSGIARADSIAYNVLGTFSNGQQLSGQITWNNASNSVTSSTLSLSSSTFSAACSSGCGAVFANFWGTGTLAKSYETLLGTFLPNSSVFGLTVVGNGGIRIMATNVSWARVAVPEESVLAELLIVLMGFAWLVKSGALSQSRKSVA